VVLIQLVVIESNSVHLVFVTHADIAVDSSLVVLLVCEELRLSSLVRQVPVEVLSCFLPLVYKGDSFVIEGRVDRIPVLLRCVLMWVASVGTLGSEVVCTALHVVRVRGVRDVLGFGQVSHVVVHAR
jgi:hypothetical protein